MESEIESDDIQYHQRLTITLYCLVFTWSVLAITAHRSYCSFCEPWIISKERTISRYLYDLLIYRLQKASI